MGGSSSLSASEGGVTGHRWVWMVPPVVPASPETLWVDLGGLKPPPIHKVLFPGEPLVFCLHQPLQERHHATLGRS